MAHDLVALAQLARAQHGKVHIRQLYELGLTKRAIECRTGTGYFRRDRRGVYAVGHEPDTIESRWSGAVLAAGPGAVLSHLAAARLWILIPWEVDRIDVSRSVQRRPVQGVTCHTVQLRIEEVTVHRGIPVTTPSRTIADCAQLLSPELVTRLLREARHLGVLDLEALEEYCAPRRRRHGAPRLRNALEQFAGHGSGFRSRYERVLRDHLVARGVPDPCINVSYSTGIGMVEADQSWPALNIVVEADGPTHDDARQQRIDVRNRAALRRAGWEVYAIHHRAFAEDPDKATDEVISAIRAAMNTTLATHDVANVAIVGRGGVAQRGAYDVGHA